MIVYKITNTVNGKMYIGITRQTQQERWRSHLSDARHGDPRPLYRSIRKHGEDAFVIEQIDTASTVEELGGKERYYIATLQTMVPNGYNLTAGGERCQLDGNPSALLTLQDVINIRNIYALKRFLPREVYKRYCSKVSYETFRKVWEGATWPDVHMDVYTDENKLFYRTKGSARCGQKNGNAQVLDEVILDARKFYVNHSLTETFLCFGGEFKNIDSFYCALTKRYLHLPVYNKAKKIWTYRGEEIPFH